MPTEAPNSIRWIYWLLVVWVAFKACTAAYYFFSSEPTASSGIEAAFILVLSLPGLLAAYMVKRGMGFAITLTIALLLVCTAIGNMLVISQIHLLYILQACVGAAAALMLFQREARSYYLSR